MKLVKYCGSLCLFLYICAGVQAQDLSNARRRSFNAKLLKLAGSYEYCAAFGDRADRASFLDLCIDSSAPVVSDLPEHSFGKTLTAEEYADVLSARENVMVSLKNIKRGDYSFSDGVWRCKLSFDKQLSYNDVNGVLFSIDEYYGADLHMEFSCVYDERKDDFLIESIVSSVDSDTPDLPETFDVLEKSDERDDRLLADGKPLRFNSFGQAFIPKGSVTPWNDDVRIRKNYYARTEKYDYFTNSYKSTRFRAKIRTGYAAGGSLKITGGDELSTKKSSGWQFGAELGYAIPVGRGFTVSLFTGAGYSFSSLDLAAGDISYSYRLNNSAGVAYDRSYHISVAENKLSFKDIYVPVYLNFDIRLAKGVLLGLDVGARVYFTGITHADLFHVAGTVSGNAPSFTESDAVGDFDLYVSKFLYPGSYSRGKMDYSLTAGISLSFDIYSGYVWVYARCGYETGIANLHESAGAVWFSENSVFPVVYYSQHDGWSNVVTRSFADCVSYKRQALWPELGMMFKF